MLARLAQSPRGWHGGAMNRPAPLAGGCLLSASLLGGVGLGLWLGEPSIGFLAGLGAGLLLLVLVLLIDRARR
jgi:hypothetical protein